jgi:hypothetical protein
MSRLAISLISILVLGASPALAHRPDQEELQWQDAAKTPLRDINVMPDRIPLILRQAEDGAYRWPNPANCQAIAGEVRELDAVLGDDFDVPPDTTPLTRDEKRMSAANVVLKGAAGSVVPFRGWVRQLTGAERHAQVVQTAIAAGRVRRAFLKGVGLMLRCRTPASPLRFAVTAARSR